MKERDAAEGQSPISSEMLFQQLPGYHRDTERVGGQCVPAEATAKLNSKGQSTRQRREGRQREEYGTEFSRFKDFKQFLYDETLWGEKGRGSKRLGKSDLQEPVCFRLWSLG